MVRHSRASAQSSDSDEDLVAAVADADAAALGLLWDRHARPVFSLALRILADPGWAEEVTQDVFVRLWTNPHAYNATRGDLRTWLLTVAHHASVDGLRSKQGTARQRNRGSEPLAFLVQRDADPSEQVWRQVRADEVRHALALLPDVQRDVIELVYFGGLTHAEVALQTGQPLGTVKSRVRLGVQKLRDTLAGTGLAE